MIEVLQRRGSIPLCGLPADGLSGADAGDRRDSATSTDPAASLSLVLALARPQVKISTTGRTGGMRKAP
jgi:hypothetical protein